MRRLLLVLTAAISPHPASAADYRVATVAEIDAAINRAEPGDSIVLRDGTWNDFDVLFDAQGTAEAPITLRAETPGKAIISGPSRLRFGGRHLVVSGLYFRRAYSDDHLIAFRRNSKQLAEHCRLTQCKLEDCNHPSDSGESRWISLYGKNNRLDRCSIAGKTNKGATLVAFLGPEPSEHRISGNYFGPRPRLDGNGGETIRIGDSDTAHLRSWAAVEYNCFEACDGEAEIISNKSCENTYRYNTFLRCSGALTLRHGDDCTVQGNYFLGQKARGSGGVRIIGQGHRVINNYFSDLEGDDQRAALSIMNGLENSPADGYRPVRQAVVAFNTFVNCKETLVVGHAEDADASVPPADCTIVNNLVVTRRVAVDVRNTPVKFRWQGNLVQGELGFEDAGIQKVDDLKLRRVGDLWTPGASSPARDAAATGLADITEDIRGRQRDGRKDVGCEEASEEPPRRGPIYPDDAGVTWDGDRNDE